MFNPKKPMRMHSTEIATLFFSVGKILKPQMKRKKEMMNQEK